MTPKKRRQYGTGSVYRRADGLWVGRIERGWTATTGKRRRIQVTGKTEAIVKTKLKDAQREKAIRTTPAAGSARTTVKTWVDTWLPIYRGEVKPGVYRTNSSLVRRWIIPELGHVMLSEMMPQDVRTMHRAITGAGRSSTTARNAHVILMRMLRAAEVDGYDVPKNLYQMKAPPQAVSDRDAIPVADLKRILTVAHDGGDYARWAASLLNGARRGETLGLTWDCVDLDRGTIDISWQLQPVPYLDKRDRSKGFQIPPDYEARHLTGALHLLRPKTTKGRRILPLVPWLRGELLTYRQSCPDSRWGLVWTERDGRGQTIPRRLNQDRLAWHALQAAASVQHPSGRPYHLHEARHATATILMENGVDERIIMAIMGHSTMATTRGYQHVSQDLAAAALEGVAAAIRPDVIASVAVDNPEVPAIGAGLD